MPRFDLPRCATLILEHRCCLPERHSGDHLWTASEDVQWDLYRLLNAWLTAHGQGKVQFVPQYTGDAAALNELWRETCTTLLVARGESPVQSPGDHQESNTGAQGGQEEARRFAIGGCSGDPDAH